MASLEGLRSAMASLPDHLAANTHVHVFLNGFSTSGDLNLYAGFVSSFLNQLGKPMPSVTVHGDVPQGNAVSFAFVLATLRSMALPPDALVFLMEDDVILQDSALVEIYEIFESHSPCFVSPIDFAEFYTLGDAGGGRERIHDGSRHSDYFSSSSIVVAGRRRHWRTAVSTAVTYVSRMATLDFWAAWLPRPTDDLLQSAFLSQEVGASILSPLPSLAVVSENLSDLTEPSFSLYYEHSFARNAYERGLQAWCEFLGSSSDKYSSVLGHVC